MVVLGVGLEVLGQVVDALGQDRDLHLGGAGIAGFLRIFLDERVLRSAVIDIGYPFWLVWLNGAFALAPGRRPGRDVVQRGRVVAEASRGRSPPEERGPYTKRLAWPEKSPTAL